MPAPISVIIPTLNAERELQGCLTSLIPGLEAGLIREAVIVDGHSTDQSVPIACDWGARVICASDKGRGHQLRTGAINARGDWLLFLHADTQLGPGWVQAVRHHMETAPSKAAAFSLQYRSEARQARWLERRANLRARVLGLPYGDQGLLISRAFYDALGGIEPLPLMEDVDIVRRIGKSRLELLPCAALTSAEKYERDGWRKRAWANALLLIRYYLGASPEKLAGKYR